MFIYTLMYGWFLISMSFFAQTVLFPSTFPTETLLFNLLFIHNSLYIIRKKM